MFEVVKVKSRAKSDVMSRALTPYTSLVPIICLKHLFCKKIVALLMLV